jgi:hypothetical protein
VQLEFRMQRKVTFRSQLKAGTQELANTSLHWRGTNGRTSITKHQVKKEPRPVPCHTCICNSTVLSVRIRSKAGQANGLGNDRQGGRPIVTSLCHSFQTRRRER